MREPAPSVLVTSIPAASSSSAAAGATQRRTSGCSSRRTGSLDARGGALARGVGNTKGLLDYGFARRSASAGSSPPSASSSLSSATL
eukprot:5536453-Alexandrium_andersonii.AAC.1